jgi:hypothetical protein
MSLSLDGAESLAGEQEATEASFGEVVVAGERLVQAQLAHDDKAGAVSKRIAVIRVLRNSTKRSVAIDQPVDLGIAQRSTWPIKTELVQVQQRIIHWKAPWGGHFGWNQARHGLSTARHRNAFTFFYSRQEFREVRFCLMDIDDVFGHEPNLVNQISPVKRAALSPITAASRPKTRLIGAIAIQMPFGLGTDQRRCQASAIPVQGQCAQALETGWTGLEPAVLESH